MKLFQAKVAMVSLGLLVASSSGCSVVNKLRAKNELNETARSYKEGKFEEAEQHARKAVELDPTNKTAPIFVARTIHSQYKPGIDTPENLAKARSAIEAYQRILQNDPTNEEGYKAVAALYGAIKEDQKLRDWIAQRANDTSLKPDQRAEAMAILAGKDWDCSFKITELPENKLIVKGSEVQFKKPKDQKDFDTAHMCVVRGLEQAEKAINLDANNEAAWSYKTNLLTEAARLAEMDGKLDQKAQFSKQADDARKRAGVLSEERRKKEQEAANAATPPTG
jgi:tetratricopeptide (TPR) repeat protein